MPSVLPFTMISDMEKECFLVGAVFVRQDVLLILIQTLPENVINCIAHCFVDNTPNEKYEYVITFIH